MIELKDFAKEIEAELAEFVQAEKAVRQKAIKAGAELLADKLKQASPRKTGKFAESWSYEMYGDRAYVYNKREVKTKSGKKYSLANILEYKPGGKPFIRKTAENHKGEVQNKIIEIIRGG